MQSHPAALLQRSDALGAWHIAVSQRQRVQHHGTQLRGQSRRRQCSVKGRSAIYKQGWRAHSCCCGQRRIRAAIRGHHVRDSLERAHERALIAGGQVA